VLLLAQRIQPLHICPQQQRQSYHQSPLIKSELLLLVVPLLSQGSLPETLSWSDSVSLSPPLLSPLSPPLFLRCSRLWCKRGRDSSFSQDSMQSISSLLPLQILNLAGKSTRSFSTAFSLNSRSVFASATPLTPLADSLDRMCSWSAISSVSKEAM
jgi:hypothetical protein